MTINRANILKDDQSKNTIHSFSTVTTFSLTVRIGMWGADMFGSPTILGAGVTNTYNQGQWNVKLSPTNRRLNVVQV